MKLEKTARFRFDAAHHLPDYDGKCKKVHGHTYFFEVCCAGSELDENGMLFDTEDLEEIVKERILSKLDHSDLNETLENPTAENIAIWIYGQLKDSIKNERYQLKEIKVQEGEKSSVSYQENEALTG